MTVRALSSFTGAVLLVLLALTALSCSEAPDDSRLGVVLPSGSEAAFGPVGDFLDHRCGSLDCHGKVERNLRFWGCEGMRLSELDVSICSRAKGGRRTTAEEHVASYRSLIGLEPTVMSTVVEGHGRDPQLLTFVRKARGLEAHKGGALIVPGDDQDHCITSWLAGQTNLTACNSAFSEPAFPPVPPP
jgi:hypothetical protein